MNQELLEKCKNADLLKEVAKGKEVVWINENLEKTEDAMAKINITMADIDDAEARLARFAPFLMKKFPETIPTNGLIESPLTYIPNMQKKLEEHYDTKIPGKMFLKQDSHLAISGSVKARGGIYEVLKHAEDLALEHGMLRKDDDYSVFASDEFKEFFSKFKIQVGSTGNLGMSIGIMSAALGFHVIVHMSADAKQWKKDLLRQRGAEVVEYADDYSKAVEVGRKNSDADPNSYFVDDENSVTLFLGYAVAAKRIVKQFAEKNIIVDAEHPLFVYIPCGVGGAPGGVAFGFKKLFGDNVHVFFTEPTQAPCMLVGMASGLQNKVCVKDFGLSGLTHADGLAVGHLFRHDLLFVVGGDEQRHLGRVGRKGVPPCRVHGFADLHQQPQQDAVSEVGVEDEEYPRPEEYRYGRHASKSSVNTCFIWLSHERRPSTVPRICAGVRCSPS